MAAEDFFNRWSRHRQAAGNAHAAMPETSAGAADVQAPQQAISMPAFSASSDPAPAPALPDLEKLRPDSDFSSFMASEVDRTVRRLAMKKLFSDPHFNAMDGLDIHMEDYNKFEPLSAAMVGMLHHAKSVLDPSPLFERAAKQSMEPAPAQRQDEAAGESAAGHPETADPEPAAPLAEPSFNTGAMDLPVGLQPHMPPDQSEQSNQPDAGSETASGMQPAMQEQEIRQDQSGMPELPRK